MKIVVLGGSPKGAKSVTLQYVYWLEQEFPQHNFTYHHVGQRSRALESKPEAFQEVLDAVAEADAVLWATPVYYLLVPSGYKRFIELLFERGAEEAFAGKYAAALTTSIHFYDHTAHNYLHAISEDLGMHYVTFLSAEMSDLFKEEGRAAVRAFGEAFLGAVAEGRPTQRRFAPLKPAEFVYQPGEPLADKTPVGAHKVLVLHDARAEDANLRAMVARFTAALDGDVSVVNLRELDIKGGCLGCLRCGYNNECAYEGKDEYTTFYREQVLPADAVVFAGTIHDRFLSYKWKQYMDRSFFLGHTPTLLDKQIAYLVSGPLQQEANLHELLRTYVEMSHANLAGIVTDEVATSAELDALLDTLAGDVAQLLAAGYVRPNTFRGVGGKLLFRDAIWGQLRPMFQADHRVYRRLGWYKSFPQRQWRMRLQSVFLTNLLKLPFVRKQFTPRIVDGMVAPYRKVVDRGE